MSQVRINVFSSILFLSRLSTGPPTDRSLFRFANRSLNLIPYRSPHRSTFLSIPRSLYIIFPSEPLCSFLLSVPRLIHLSFPQSVPLFCSSSIGYPIGPPIVSSIGSSIESLPFSSLMGSPNGPSIVSTIGPSTDPPERLPILFYPSYNECLLLFQQILKSKLLATHQKKLTEQFGAPKARTVH